MPEILFALKLTYIMRYYISFSIYGIFVLSMVQYFLYFSFSFAQSSENPPPPAIPEYCPETGRSDTDLDGDGLPNLQEELLGTNPRDCDTDHDKFFDQWEVKYKFNPNNQSEPNPRADDDGDNLGNYLEYKHNTDPTNSDSDGDGLNDSQELLVYRIYRLDPLDPDTDDDGLSDKEEILLGTHPNNQDTDGDMLSDFQEIKVNKTDPIQKDSDQGGIEDGEEVRSWNTDPNNPLDDLKDSDGDGLLDYFESNFSQTNPFMADSDQDFFKDSEELTITLDSVKGEITLLNTYNKFSQTIGYSLDQTSRKIILKEQFDFNLCKTDKAGLTNCFDSDNDQKVDWLDQDSDDDQIVDGKETKPFVDTDKDGFNNVIDADSDNDGLADGLEVESKTDPLEIDSDFDGLPDGDEVSGLFKSAGGGLVYTSPQPTNPLKPDSDGCGILDFVEVSDETDPNCSSPFNHAQCDLNITHECDDGEPRPCLTGDCQGKYEYDPRDEDKDHLSNSYEKYVIFTDFDNQDTDGDGLPDAEEVFPLQDRRITKGIDADHDDDGLLDGRERFFGTDPTNWDSDNDGIPDGLEVGPDLQNISNNPSGQEYIDRMNVYKQYLTKQLAGNQELLQKKLAQIDTILSDLQNPTDKSKGNFQEDKDPGACLLNQERFFYKTNPRVQDTDGDGLPDGGRDLDGDGIADFGEDLNINGKLDPDETSPCLLDTDGDGLSDYFEWRYSLRGASKEIKEHAQQKGYQFFNPNHTISDSGQSDYDGDGLRNIFEQQLGTNPLEKDTDGDGLSDFQEVEISQDGEGGQQVETISDPLKEDSDEDLVIDGKERKPFEDSDGDGLVNVMDSDSDDDGLSDGQEDKDRNGDWDKKAGETNFLDSDSDDDGLSDFAEVYGQHQLPEGGYTFFKPTDPNKKDTDDDGLSDKQEVESCSKPHNKDSDGDTLEDGQEVAGIEVVIAGQTRVFVTDPCRRDSDGDGLEDQVELGRSGPGANPTDPTDSDTDDDQLLDGSEDSNRNGRLDAGETDPNNPDSDNDMIKDGCERVLEKRLQKKQREKGLAVDTISPTKADTDGDGIIDGYEVDTSNCKSSDLDGDGYDDVVDDDSDGDGLSDRQESGLGTAGGQPRDSDKDQKPDFVDKDSDGDGISDGDECRGLVRECTTSQDWRQRGIHTCKCQPKQAAACDVAKDSDQDGVPDYLDLDADNDGNPDKDESIQDLDCDGIPDYLDQEDHDGPMGDPDSDGLSNIDETGIFKTDPKNSDSDCDGVLDGQEVEYFLNPLDQDSDDDGLKDGQESDTLSVDLVQEAQANQCLTVARQFNDKDQDGLNNGLDPDSDNDGILDGTETGIYQAVKADGAILGTDKSKGFFVPDKDQGATTTNPNLKDTDDGGVADGAEDANHNGAVDSNETNPDDSADDLQIPADQDKDGLSDAEENLLKSNPQDSDSDDDGLLDGEEHNPSIDSDGDGLINLLDPDSDNDQLPDGLEAGKEIAGQDTDLNKGFFVGDQDKSSTTWPLMVDSDQGGVADGMEDYNRDGLVDQDETDPNKGDDDCLGVGDIDKDSLANWLEISLLATSCTQADSDGDGLSDKQETDPYRKLLLDEDKDQIMECMKIGNSAVCNWQDLDGVAEAQESIGQEKGFDADGDGIIDALDLDSDGDSIGDHLEGFIPEGHQELFGKVCKTVEAPVDCDGDGRPDYLDLDSDNDTLSDKIEAHEDANGKAEIQKNSDASAESENPKSGGAGEKAGQKGEIRDSDGDLVPDFRDQDSDGDGIGDKLEAWGPGIIQDTAKEDGEGNSENGPEEEGAKMVEKPHDQDGDGQPDYLDLDSDNDSLEMTLEELLDKNEVGDDPASPRDSDGDGLPDFRDQDSDNGGAYDWEEVKLDKTDPTLKADDFTGRLERGAIPLGGDIGCSCSQISSGVGLEENKIFYTLLILWLVIVIGRWINFRARMFPVASSAHKSRFLFFFLLFTLLVTGYTGVKVAAAEDESVDIELFRPALGPLGPIYTDSGDSLPKFNYHLGLLLNYLHLPLKLNAQGETIRNLVDYRVSSHLIFCFSLTDYWEFGVSAPLILHQQGLRLAKNTGEIESEGLGDIHLKQKLVFWVQKNWGLDLAALGTLVLPVGNKDRYGGDPNLQGEIGLAATKKFAWGATAFNLGYRTPRGVDSYTMQLEDMLIYKASARYKLPLSWLKNHQVTVLGELLGATAARSPFKKTITNPLELVLAAKYQVSKNIHLTAGAAKALQSGIGTANWRIFAGLSYYTLIKDSDKDGLIDDLDRCPLQPEDMDNFQDQDGCPDKDNDQDKIPDPVDGCPNKPEDRDNFQDQDGCPDVDNDQDNILDTYDKCPNKKEDYDGVEDGDGCPDIDADRDGIKDELDKCPLEPEDKDKVADEDGCPEEDADEDKIVDLKDKCPLEPENYNQHEDEDGCPDKIPQDAAEKPAAVESKEKNGAGKEKPETVEFDPNFYYKICKGEDIFAKCIHFEYNQTDILAYYHPQIEEMVKWLQENQWNELWILGHSDRVGTDPEYNHKISVWRTMVFRDFLVAKGIDKKKIYIKGFGDTQPLDRNDTARGRLRNRRVEIRVVKSAPEN